MLRYLEVSICCGRSVADGLGDLVAAVTGSGYAVDDPLDIIRAQEQGSWDASDLVPGDPARVLVKGWIADTGAVEQARLRLEEGLEQLRQHDLGELQRPEYRWVAEEDWANAWKAYFKPLKVGERFVIIPSWEDYQLGPADLPLYLDPGMAFGTGTHPTTALCLRWLESLVKPHFKVLDVGTGSGILAVAAARLQASPVVAMDIDPVAVRVAAENVSRNQVAVEVRLCTLDQLEGEKADLIVANIIASVIGAILPDVASRLKSGGHFLASGIIAERANEVLEAMTATWLLPVAIREEGGWVAILAAKP